MSKQTFAERCQIAEQCLPDTTFYRAMLTKLHAEMLRALAEQPSQQNSPWCMKMNGCKTKCEDCPDEVAEQPAQQEPVAWMQEMPTQEDEARSVRLTTLKEHATLEWDNPVPLYAAPPQPPAQQAPDYAWPTVQDYEADVGFKVNDAFQMGWHMARTTNDLFKQMGEST